MVFYCYFSAETALASFMKYDKKYAGGKQVKTLNIIRGRLIFITISKAIPTLIAHTPLFITKI